MNKLTLTGNEAGQLREPWSNALSDTEIDNAEQKLGMPRGFIPEGLLVEIVNEHIEGLRMLDQILKEQTDKKETLAVE